MRGDVKLPGATTTRDSWRPSHQLIGLPVTVVTVTVTVTKKTNRNGTPRLFVRSRVSGYAQNDNGARAELSAAHPDPLRLWREREIP